MRKTKTEKITGIDEQILNLQKQKKELIQKQKEDDRKARTSRLCSRHGKLEKCMPELITITDEQFEQFIKRGINTSYGQKVLSEIIGKAGTSAPAANAESKNGGGTEGDGTKASKTPPNAEE